MKRCWILLSLLLASCRGGGGDSRELMTANLSALETAVDMESRRVDGDDVLAFDEAVVDLGEVPLGESRTIRVEAENVARKPVVVLEAYTSCDCTKVSFGKKPVRSGETIVFTVDFSEVPGFVPTVARYLADIESLGMAAALKKFLNA